MGLPGGIGEIYLISTAIGVIYFGFGILMGQLHGLVQTHSGHIGGNAHISAANAGNVHHHLAADAAAHHQLAQGSGADHQSGHAVHQAAEHNHALHPPHVGEQQNSDLSATSSHTLLHLKRTTWLAALLSALNPMTLAIFLTFFGLTGLILLSIAPQAGLISAAAATLVSFFVTARVLRLFAWLLLQAGASSEGRIEDLVGQMAQVTVPIREGRMGEVTCVMGSKRYNYPARAKVSGNSFLTASMVMIADLRQGVVYVEPWNDPILQTESGSIIEITQMMKESRPAE